MYMEKASPTGPSIQARCAPATRRSLTGRWRAEEVGKLSPADEIKLTNWRAGQRAEWNRMHAILHDYKEKNCNCLVSKHSGNVSKLAAWMTTQRAQHKLKDEGKPSQPTDERKALLDEIGFTYRVTLPWDIASNSWKRLEAAAARRFAILICLWRFTSGAHPI